MTGLKRAKPVPGGGDARTCTVVVRNITLSRDLPRGERATIKPGAAGLTLVLPESFCADGNLLLLRFFDDEEYQKVRNSPRSVQDKAQLLSLTGRVSRVGPGLEPGRMEAAVELQAQAEKDWAALQKKMGGGAGASSAAGGAKAGKTAKAK